jgi:DNA-binding PadR family transcriptional regulator
MTDSRRDKRTRSDLELFILALLQTGVNTPYKLHAEANISPGASIPVFSRLEKSGYVRRGKPGARGKAEYVITATGRQYLKGGWRPLLEDSVSSDVDAILRVAALAILSGADRRLVTDYLLRAAAEKIQTSKLRQAGSSKPVNRNGAGLYQRMRSEYSSAKLSSEAKVLHKLAVRLKKMKFA